MCFVLDLRELDTASRLRIGDEDWPNANPFFQTDINASSSALPNPFSEKPNIRYSPVFPVVHYNSLCYLFPRFHRTFFQTGTAVMIVDQFNTNFPDDSADCSPENRNTSRRRSGSILVTKPEGRLGNQLFAFSHLIAYALDNGYRILNPSFYHYGHFFRGTCRDPLCRIPQLRWGFAPKFTFNMTGWLAKHFHSLVKRLPRLFTFIDAGGSITDLEDDAIKRHVESKKPLIFYGWTFRCRTCVHLYENEIRNYFRPIEKHQSALIASIKIYVEAVIYSLASIYEEVTFANFSEVS